MIQGAEIIATANRYLRTYTRDTEAWFPDEKECWVLGKLVDIKIDDTDVEMTFSIGRGKKITEFKCTIEKLIEMKGENLPPLQNPPALNGIDNLAMLSHLNEPAVFHNLWLRYLNGYIYTYSGIVLIAMNPFTNVGIYGESVIRDYQNKSRDNMDPHVYAVAEEALRNLKEYGKNQSIIVSGESGAGKTQSARYLMEYFAYANKPTQTRHPSSCNQNAPVISGIEEAVLSTNPIMESFGNSKTVRNDNSSRFGKYTEILFSDCPETGELRICSARIRTYLLERSRVIFQPLNERNFHIFYQLCAGAPAAEKEELCLNSWEHFHYLNQGKAGVVDGVNDAHMFTETTKALSSAKISLTTQWNIFRVCASILHIGNINIKLVRDRVIIDDNDEALNTAVRLLGIDRDEFKKWLLNKTIKMKSERIVKPLNHAQATVVRDSVAKYLYSSLFSWLVSEIGINLEKNKNPSSTPKNFIGVLDIYGFEHFDENSFEQFCINYANEKLQQEFNSHVFKLEQDEYVKEQIKWSFIPFSDNQECINLIEGKHGIFDLLNEESLLQMGSDKSLLIKLNDRFIKKNAFYSSPRFGQDTFTINHYACDVTYRINGFIEKNKDTVPEEQHQLLMTSSFGFIKDILNRKMESDSNKSSITSLPALKSKTLGSIFKSSLASLMDTICQTEVHYIRCIKPNYQCYPFKFDPKMVLQQLRACGVLETIEISCKGYPTRATFDDFVDRYYMLVKSDLYVADPREFTVVIVNDVLDDSDKFQIGLTKVFFRAGQLAYMEKLRNDKQVEAARTIQRYVSRHYHKKKFTRMMNAALKIQCAFRKYMAVKLSYYLRCTNAATIVQKNYRRHLAVVEFLYYKKVIVRMQTVYRYKYAQNLKKELLYKNACTIIQKSWRSTLQRRIFTKMVFIVILLQSRIRTLFILNQVPQLLAEARSVGKLKESNHRLENKVIELSRKLEDARTHHEKLVQDISHYMATIEKWKTKCNNLEIRNEDIQNDINDLRNDYESRIDEINEDVISYKLRIEEIERQLNEKNSLITEYERIFTNIPIDNSTNVDNFSFPSKNVITARYPKDINKSDLGDKRLPNQAINTILTRSQDIGDSISNKYPYSLSRSQMADEDIVSNEKGLYSASMGINHTYYEKGSHSRILGTTTPFNTDWQRNTVSSDHLRSPALINEVRCFIINLSMPHIEDSEKMRTDDWSVLFVANILGEVALLILNKEFYTEFMTYMRAAVAAMCSKSDKLKDNNEYSFWVSNIYTFLRIIHTILRGPEMKKETEEASEKYSDMAESIASCYKELENFVVKLIDMWIEFVKRSVEPTVVPAIVESQPLPGYAIQEKKRSKLLFNMMRTRKQLDFKVDDIVSYLDGLLISMKTYHVDEKIQYQIVSEIYSLINYAAFNDLLHREGFWTWMRGLQLSYNVSVLQDWCQNNKFAGIQHSLIRLEHASQLIAMNKTILDMAETVFDVCFSLNSVQIIKIVEIYTPIEGEPQVSPEFLSVITDNKRFNKEYDCLSVEVDKKISWFEDILGPNLLPYAPQRKPVPRWLAIPIISRILNNTIINYHNSQ